MDEIRWILLGLGAAVVAGIYGFTRWQEGRREGARRRRSEPFTDEVDIDQAFQGLDGGLDEAGRPERMDDVELGEVRVRPVGRPAEAADEPVAVEAEEAAAVPAGEDKVIVLSVTAEGTQFSGAELVEALEAAGLRYGEHAIFHRMLDTRTGPVSLYSAANILKPGTFEPEQRAQMSSPGVALFLQLPGPADGLATFEQMLVAARRIAERLPGAKVLDGRRCSLTQQALEAIREDLREYRRRAHLAAKKNG